MDVSGNVIISWLIIKIFLNFNHRPHTTEYKVYDYNILYINR